MHHPALPQDSLPWAPSLTDSLLLPQHSHGSSRLGRAPLGCFLLMTEWGGGWSWVILAQRGLCRGAVFAQRRPIDLAGMFSKRHCRMKRFLPNPASVQPFLHGFSTVIVLRLSSPSPATSPSSFFMAMTWFTRICRHILYLFILHPLSLFTEKQI